MKIRSFVFMLSAAILAAGCRGDEYVVASDTQNVRPAQPAEQPSPADSMAVVGMYVLNEGNMGSNKCTVDYLDLAATDGTVRYLRNIFPERNPSVLKELGDVGNDVKVYGSKLWMVINMSNKVEVATADSCKRLAKIDIPNCRYVTFDGGFAYVSSYVGPMVVSANAPIGRVYKIDTLSLQKVDSVEVGFQPEELAVAGGRLYVANSGGYRVPQYDRTVSVVNLSTFEEERKIDVAENLHRLKTDRYGQLWVTSRGDYWGSPSRIFWLSRGADGMMQVGDTIRTAVSDMCIVGDSLYYYGVNFNYTTGKNDVNYGIINVKTHQMVTDRLTEAPELSEIMLPYGIIVNPYTRDFYVMDAKDYVSSGELFHFKADGTFDYRVWTGDIPGHAAFVMKKIK